MGWSRRHEAGLIAAPGRTNLEGIWVDGPGYGVTVAGAGSFLLSPQMPSTHRKKGP